MKKIQIYVEEIKYCEVDKQVILLANSLSDFFDITMVSIGKIKNEIALNKKVKLVEFNIHDINGYLNQLKLKNNISKFVKNNECDIVISTSLMINKILSSINLSSELIYWRLDEAAISDNDFKKYLKGFSKIVFDNEEEKNYYSFSNIECLVISPAIVSVSLDFDHTDNKNILYVGSIDDKVIFDNLVSIVKKVKKEYDDVKLYIIGENKKRLEMNNFFKENGLQNNIIFYGNMDSNELDYELKRMDIFINFENSVMANVRLIEAMNYGLPPISYYNETLKNIIENDINGYLIKENDIDDFADKILLILSSSDSLSNMRQCARETSMFYEINSIKGEWLKIL